MAEMMTKIDLVILNEHETGYSQDLSNHLFRVIRRMDGEEWLNRRGGIFLLRADQMEEADRILLETAARVVLYGNEGPLSEQLNGRKVHQTRLPNLVPILPTPSGPISNQPISRPKNLQFDNGIGGFSPDGREYILYFQPGQHTLFLILPHSHPDLLKRSRDSIPGHPRRLVQSIWHIRSNPRWKYH